MSEPVEFIIIGSGVSGAIVSALFKTENRSHVILEKYDRPGGRFSTVEIDGRPYNHGNLFIRDSHDYLIELINHFSLNLLQQIRMDYVNLIENSYHIDSRNIFLPESGRMDDICTRLIGSSEIIYNADVKHIAHQVDRYVIQTTKTVYEADNVILTVDPRSTQSLLKPLGHELQAPKLNAIFTLLATYQQPDAFDFPYYKFINHRVLKEIFIDRRHQTVVIHANDYIHEDMDELNTDFINKTIYDTYRQYFKVPIEITGSKIWKYAKDRKKTGYPHFFYNGDNCLFIVTDWAAYKCNANGVENSFQFFLKDYATLKERHAI